MSAQIMSESAWRTQQVRDLAEEFGLTLVEARSEAPSWWLDGSEWWQYVLTSVMAGRDLTTRQLRALTEGQWQELCRSSRLMADDALRADWGRARAGWSAAERHAMADPVHDFDPVHDGCRRCGALPLDGVPCEPPEPMTTTPKENDR